MKATLQDLLVEEVRDLFDAEKQLTKALPKMARAAGDAELRKAFQEHLEVTRKQVQRLERIFRSMDMRARGKPCAGMKGLIEEGKEVQEEDFPESIMDAALLGAGRRVEHYEIAAYTAAVEMAQQAGMREAAQLLQQTLREEMETEKRLSQIARRVLKQASLMRPEEREEKSGKRRKPASRSGTGRSNARGASRGGGSARPLVNHEEIRNWAEERGAQPACVRGTGGGRDTGMIRLDFPGYSGEESLEPISWDDWFEKFDENGLALLVQNTTESGEKSNFNKLVKRERAKHAGE
jgi:ferritin-like metal-binding protein YciE